MTFSFNIGGLTPQDAQTGSSGTTVVEGFSPANTAGLCLYLDGEINSRAGVHDETLSGMQNLVYTPYTGFTTNTGCREVLNGTPTFTDKSCKLGGTMFVPCYSQTALTFEFVGSFDTNNFDNVINQQVFTNSVYVGGYQIFATAEGLNYQLFNESNTNVKNIVYSISFEANKTYHFAVTDDFTKTGVTKFYVNGEEVDTVVNKDATGGVCTKITNIGIMGVHNSTGVQSVYPVTENGAGCFYGEYTNVNAFRLWNRALSAEEIKTNYNNDKRRFG